MNDLRENYFTMQKSIPMVKKKMEKLENEGFLLDRLMKPGGHKARCAEWTGRPMATEAFVRAFYLKRFIASDDESAH